MNTPESAALFDLYLISNFLAGQALEEILAELASAPEELAVVYGQSEQGAVDERVRKVMRLLPSAEIVQRVRERLLSFREEIGAHFGISLNNCEEAQFLRYRVGDFFVAHQDGGTGMVLSERDQFRKISVVIFLNQQAESSEAGSYEGGSLVFTEWRPTRPCGQYSLKGQAGTLVAFPSDTTHEVIPVTRGERYSIVSWYG